MAQINSGTLADFQNRMPGRINDLGTSSVEDLRDVIKNLQLASLIQRFHGW